MLFEEKPLGAADYVTNYFAGRPANVLCTETDSRCCFSLRAAMPSMVLVVLAGLLVAGVTAQT